MALGDSYASLDDMKVYVNVVNSNAFDTLLTDALLSASEEIERYCNRQFNKATSATARVYVPDGWIGTSIDDFHTTTGLVIKTDASGDGTFETTWASTDYELKPFNGIVDGQTGWPYNEIAAVGSQSFPCPYDSTARRARLEVTAQWGWAAVPAPVKQACLMLAAKNFQLKDAPLGVAGMGEFGFVRVQDDRGAMAKLKPYRRYGPLVG